MKFIIFVVILVICIHKSCCVSLRKRHSTHSKQIIPQQPKNTITNFSKLNLESINYTISNLTYMTQDLTHITLDGILKSYDMRVLLTELCLDFHLLKGLSIDPKDFLIKMTQEEYSILSGIIYSLNQWILNKRAAKEWEGKYEKIINSTSLNDIQEMKDNLVLFKLPNQDLEPLKDIIVNFKTQNNMSDWMPFIELMKYHLNDHNGEAFQSVFSLFMEKLQQIIDGQKSSETLEIEINPIKAKTMLFNMDEIIFQIKSYQNNHFTPDSEFIKEQLQIQVLTNLTEQIKNQLYIDPNALKILIVFPNLEIRKLHELLRLSEDKTNFFHPIILKLTSEEKQAYLFLRNLVIEEAESTNSWILPANSMIITSDELFNLLIFLSKLVSKIEIIAHNVNTKRNYYFSILSKLIHFQAQISTIWNNLSPNEESTTIWISIDDFTLLKLLLQKIQIE